MNSSQAKLTRQGVPDLNPKGYNGRPLSCACYRNPELPTRIEKQVRTVTLVTPGAILTEEKLVAVHVCSFCGRDRGSEHDEA